jgi:hypothetical protein
MFAIFRNAKKQNRLGKTWEIIINEYRFSPSTGLMEHAQSSLLSMSDYMDEHNLAVYFLGIYGESIDEGSLGATEQFKKFKEKIETQMKLGLVNDQVALKEFSTQAERFGLNCEALKI